MTGYCGSKCGTERETKEQNNAKVPELHFYKIKFRTIRRNLT